MFRFFPGLLFIQCITTGLVVLAFRWLDNLEIVITIGVFAVIVTILASFWFASIARDQQKEQVSRLKERLKAHHAREREQLLLDAEREKASVVNESHERITRETQRAHAKANFKVGATVAAAAGVGGIMILTQFVTVGLMLLVGSGSGLAGYLMRVRQERQAFKHQPVVDITASVEKLSGPGAKHKR